MDNEFVGGFLRDWAHEDELRPGDPMPSVLVKTARSKAERRLFFRDWYCFWGYHDALKGSGYREGFEDWQVYNQLIYQAGRTVVSQMIEEGVDPPEWPDRIECEAVALWLDDRRRRFPDELLLPVTAGGNSAALV